MNMTAMPFTVRQPSVGCSDLLSSINAVVNTGFNLTFKIFDSTTGFSIPSATLYVSILFYFL